MSLPSFARMPAHVPRPAAERQQLLDFFAVYDSHYDLVVRETMELASNHAEFGPLVRAMSPGQIRAQNERSRGLLRGAFVDQEWEPYVADLRAQGALYANLGVSFGGWYDVVRGFQRVLVPILVQSFGENSERLAGSITAMIDFLDWAMSLIAEQYMSVREEEQARRIVGAIRDYAIIMLDPSGRITSWNAGAEAIKGYTAIEAMGQHFSMFYPAEARERGEPQRVLDVAASLGRSEDEGWRVRKDGSRFWANVVVSAVRNAAGTLLGFAKVTRDLTERRRAEETLREAKEAAEAANRELEAFSYSVAHDLRAPLRGIHGLSSAVIEDYGHQVDEEGQEFLRRIMGGAERMGHLIDALLELARVGRTELVRRTVDLGTLADVVVKRFRSQSLGRTVEFTRAGDFVVEADPNLSLVLLENLLGNAWKFTSKRALAHIELGSTENDGTRVYHVRDDGPGFDMAYANKLFSPFERLHQSEEFAGNGIGLATVQRIVRRHGGRVWAEAAPGRGATFYFTLPNSLPGASA